MASTGAEQAPGRPHALVAELSVEVGQVCPWPRHRMPRAVPGRHGGMLITTAGELCLPGVTSKYFLLYFSFFPSVTQIVSYLGREIVNS